MVYLQRQLDDDTLVTDELSMTQILYLLFFSYFFIGSTSIECNTDLEKVRKDGEPYEIYTPILLHLFLWCFYLFSFVFMDLLFAISFLVFPDHINKIQNMMTFIKKLIWQNACCLVEIRVAVGGQCLLIYLIHLQQLLPTKDLWILRRSTFIFTLLEDQVFDDVAFLRMVW